MESFNTFIFGLPIYILIPIFIIAFNAAGITFLLLVRKYHVYLVPNLENEFVIEIFSDAIGLIFAFILSLVTITAWQSHNDISDSVDKEAVTLMNIYRNLEAYPPSVRDQGRGHLRDFVNEVITNEWPAMKTGQYDTKAYQILLDFANLVQRYKPQDFAELAAQQEELRLLSNYRELRAHRLLNAKPLIDNYLLFILVLAALIYLFYQSIYRMADLRSHIIMYCSLSTSVSLVFLIILIFNNPFIGPSAIGSDVFEKLLYYYWPIVH
jgi:hypothetical protein